MDAAKGHFCYPWMQEKEVSAVHGCSKGNFLLSMDAAKGTFCYPWMQERVISAIHGSIEELFLLSMDAGTFLTKHVCTHTHLCPDSFVPRLVCTTISTMCEMMRSDVRVVLHIFINICSTLIFFLLAIDVT